jgi:hypothetical protein
MNEDFLGYVLNLDEPEERGRIEERLRSNPEAAARLEVLRKLTETLEADKDSPPPPPDLVARTIGRVAEYICQQEKRKAPGSDPMINEMMARMTPDRWKTVIEVLDRANAPTRGRRADWIVAGSIMLIAFGLLLAGIPYLRYRNNVQACQNHLREMYRAVEAYADNHNGKYPRVGDPPHETAGAFLAMLHDAGVLPPSDIYHCPAAQPLYPNSYAYTLGYRDLTGQLLGLGHGAGAGEDSLAILADRPSPERTGPNPDHRYGQNVLFMGGNVRFCTSTQVGPDGDDIYRNKNGLIGAGTDIRDVVLGVAGDRP